MDITKFKTFLDDAVAKQRIYTSQKKRLEENLFIFAERESDLLEAIDVINIVGILAQEEFQEVVERLVTEALQIVFDETYSFKLENVIARNQPETTMFVIIDGDKYSLKEELGGGVLDVISFSLRIVFWAIQEEITEPLIILDEPLKFVSEDKLPCIGRLLKSISELLELQIIMVSHEQGLIEIADVSYAVQITKGTSNATKYTAV